MNDSLFEILKNSNIFGVFIYQEEGKIVYANRQLCKILGYSEDEILQKSFLEFILDDKDTVKTTIEKCIKGERFTNEYISYSFKSKSNAIVPVTIFTYTIPYKGKESGIVLVVDKTKEVSYRRLFYALHSVEKILLEAQDEEDIFEKMCKNLVNNANYSLIAIGVIDKKTKLFLPRYIEAQNEEIKNAFLSTKIGIDINTPYGAGVVSKAYNNIKISFANDFLDNQDMSHWHKFQNKTGINSVCAVPILKNNQIEYILLAVDRIKRSFDENNIQLMKNIQAILSYTLENLESKQNMLLFSKALESSHEWAVITDKDGNIIYANDAVANISKYNLNELIGKNPNIFKSGLHDEGFYKELWDTITNGKEFTCRFTNKDKNGNLFHLDTTITPVTSKGKLYFIDLSKDITKLVEQEKALKLHSNIYNILYNVTNLATSSKDKETFFHNAVNLFTQNVDFKVAFTIKYYNNSFKIGHKSTRDKKYSEFFNTFCDFLKNNGKESTIFKKSFEKGHIYIKNNIALKEEVYCKEYAKYNLASCCSIPIKQNSRTVSVLILMSNKVNFFNAEIYNLLKILSKEFESLLNKLEKQDFSNMLLESIDKGFDFFAVTDENLNIIYTKQTENIFPYKYKDIIGKNFKLILRETNDDEYIKNFDAILKNGKAVSSIFKYKAKNGKIENLRIDIVPFKKNKKIKNYTIMGKKFELKKSDFFAKQMERSLKFDALTGLYNLRSFKETIDLFIKRAKYSKKIGAIAIINPVSFKTLNMAFDFDTGNEILKEIGRRITKSLRPYDIVAKLESDRFGIILKELETEEDILIASVRLLNAITKPYKIKDKKVNITFDIGLSLFPKDGDDADTLIRKSRLALIDSKEKGENEIGFFRKDLEKKLTKNLGLRVNLEEALRHKEFVVYYQPYVDINSNIVGAESLIRWEKDDKLIPPNDFIGFLETTRLIVDVENFVFDKVLDSLKKCKLIKIKPVPISINLSERSLAQRRLSDNILSRINYYDIEKNLIKVEIIERSFIKNFAYIKNLMTELEQEGIDFSIDDFGTGYSSLSYLSKLPFKIVKIDISFVREITSNKNTQSIVKSIIFLAKELDMKVTAEGVETKEQFELLKSYGCDYFQGFLFYKPMPENQFIEVLQRQQLKGRKITGSQAKQLQEDTKKAINAFEKKSETIFLVKRQSIVDVKQNIFAYEILFQDKQASCIKPSTDMINYAKSIINMLQKMNMENLLNKHTGFIGMNDKLILSDIVKFIDKDKFIIEIDESSNVSEEFIKRISTLQRQGYRFALDNLTQSDNYRKFVPIAERISFLKIDVNAFDKKTIKKQAKNLKKIFKYLIAANIHNEEDFDFSKKTGFSYFMGTYFESPISFKAEEKEIRKPVTNAILADEVLKLLNLINSDKDADDVEKILGSFNDMALQLFAFVNSVNSSSSVIVSSIKQAIIITGYRRLKVWLIYYFVNKTSEDSASILEKAFIRGMILKGVAEDLLGYKKSEETFFIGVISLADIIFKKPKNEILFKINASQLAQDTILHNKGKLANVLSAIIADESRDIVTLRANLNVVGIIKEQYLEIKEKAYDKFKTANSIEEFIREI